MTRRIQPLYLTHNESERQATITSAILPGAEFHEKDLLLLGRIVKKLFAVFQMLSLSNYIVVYKCNSLQIELVRALISS